MQHLIGKHEVDNSLFIDGGSEILMITAREPCGDSVMGVHHTSYTIESKTVKLVFIHPKTKVGEQKSEDLVIAVIEETTEINIQLIQDLPIPKFVSTSRPFVKVTMVRAVEHIQPIEDIFTCMRMHNVEQYRDAKPMSCVDKLHEFFWCT